MNIQNRYHDHSRRVYGKRKLRLRKFSHLFKIVGVIGLIIWGNVKCFMNIDIKVISISFMNLMLL